MTFASILSDSTGRLSRVLPDSKFGKAGLSWSVKSTIYVHADRLEDEHTDDILYSTLPGFWLC